MLDQTIGCCSSGSRPESPRSRLLDLPQSDLRVARQWIEMERKVAGSERAERKTEGWNNWSAMELRWREKKKKKEKKKRKERIERRACPWMARTLSNELALCPWVPEIAIGESTASYGVASTVVTGVYNLCSSRVGSPRCVRTRLHCLSNARCPLMCHWEPRYVA